MDKFQELNTKFELVERVLERLIPDEQEREAFASQIMIPQTEEVLIDMMTPKLDDRPPQVANSKENILQAAREAVEYYEAAVAEGGDPHWPIEDRKAALKAARRGLEELESA